MNADVLVVGAGPIGTSTAWQLATAGVDVLLVGADPAAPGEQRAAYRSSGGSVCWHRPDPVKAERIRVTAEFIADRVAGGAPIRCRQTPYLFLDTGAWAPALNVSATDLVTELARLAAAAGARRHDLGTVHTVRSTRDGHVVAGERGELAARVVLLALGVGNPALVPDSAAPVEKRQLYVLDLPVGADRVDLPHLVLPIGDGYAFLFVKQLDVGLRLVLGQEDLVADDDLTGPVDHLPALLAAGVADRLPFLRGAAAERILWGVDRAEKHPLLAEHAPGLFTVNCGSAVRSCVALGAESAAAVTAALRP